MVSKLVGTNEEDRIAALAAATVTTSLEAMGTSYAKTSAVLAAIEDTKWDLFGAVAGLTGERAVAAQGIRTQLIDALSNDEYAVTLKSRLEKLERDALRLLTPPAKPPTEPVGQPIPQRAPQPPSAGTKVVDEGAQQAISATDAAALLAGLQEKLKAEPTVKLDVTWLLYREDT